MPAVGNVLMGIGLAAMVCGTVGLVRLRSFYRRLLAGALVDTAGLLLLLLGLALRQQDAAVLFKILLVMAAVLLTAPLVTHKIGRSAYLAGHREEDVPDA